MTEFQADVLTRLAKIEEKLEHVPFLVDRMRTIEHDRAKLLGWIAGVGVTASGAGALLARLGLLTFLLLFGCASQPLPAERDVSRDVSQGPVNYAWPQRPVSVVIDGRLPQQCQAAAVEAIVYWYERGVDYLDVRVVDAVPDDAFGGIVFAAKSAPDAAPEAEEGFLAVTVLSANSQTRTLGHANVHLVPHGCFSLVSAHELGHALGLDHVDDPGNLMNPTPVLDGLNAAQLEHVR